MVKHANKNFQTKGFKNVITCILIETKQEFCHPKVKMALYVYL